MSEATGIGNYFAREWHTANNGLNGVSTCSDPIDMKLVDWGGHRASSFANDRSRMESAMTCFIKSLPGPHAWGEYEDFSACFHDELENKDDWNCFMLGCQEVVKAWRDNVQSLLTEDDLSSLQYQLWDAVDYPSDELIATSSVTELLPGIPAHFFAVFVRRRCESIQKRSATNQEACSAVASSHDP